MNKQYFSVLLCLGICMSAGAQQLQNSAGCEDTLELNDHFTRKTKMIDAKLNNGDYMLGTNGKYTKVAQRFVNPYKNDPDATKKLRVTGLKAYFLAKEIVGSVDFFSLEVFKAGADSLPAGGALLQRIFATSELEDPVGSSPAVTKIVFDQSVPVGRDDFFISVEVDNSNSDDIIGLYSSFPPDGKGEKRTAVYKASESKWVFLKTEESYDADAMIIALVKEDCSSSIGEGNLNDHLKVFPNPAGNRIFVSVDVPVKELEITIYDYLGKEVLHHQSQAFSENIPIDLTDLNDGAYLLRIKYNEQFLTRKIFKN